MQECVLQFPSQTKSLVLYLNIKEKYFNEIQCGTKTKEYRDKSSHYWTRIGKNIDFIRYIWFMNGMQRNAKQMLIEFKGVDDEDPRSQKEYVLKLGNIISTDNTVIKTFVTG